MRCASCDTPLVGPGKMSSWRIEKALGGGLLVGVVCAAAWVALSESSGTGAPFVVAGAGVLVGVAARMASRSRGFGVQMAALAAFVVFVLLGEVLLYRHALLPRLEAMHQREGAMDYEIRARHEEQRLRDLSFGEQLEHYMHIEMTLALFVALAMGGGLAVLITRAPPAVAAFLAPRADEQPEPEPEPPPEPDGPDALDPPA